MTKLNKTYPAEVLGIDRVLNYNYWNQNGIGIVIVAREGRADDWAAYIGAEGSRNSSEEEAIRYVCSRGSKLSRKQAARWFPHLSIEKYRE